MLLWKIQERRVNKVYKGILLGASATQGRGDKVREDNTMMYEIN